MCAGRSMWRFVTPDALHFADKRYDTFGGFILLFQIWAAANIRARDGCTPIESLDLLVTLLRENDNCENTLADDYYVAQVK